MSPIRLIRGAAFDPETTAIMGAAYEDACTQAGTDDPEKHAIFAKRIIDAARQGEREVMKLVAYALDGTSDSSGIAEAV